MNEHKAVPNIRFEGFEDEWEEKKFSTLVNRKSHITSDSSLLSVEYENISPDNHEIHKNFNNKKGIFFQKGDILFGKLRPYLKKYVLAFYEGKAVGDFWVLSPKKDIYSRFAFYLIQTHKFYMVSNLSSGTKMPRSDWNLVSNSFFYVCNIEEQQKIGNFFAKLDKLLDLQQQKIDKLELLKKTLLQKLFPKHDAKVPELRFKGYYQEWEEKKFSSLYKKCNEKNNLSFGSNKIISVANMYYKKDNVKSDDNYMRTYNIFRLGDIAFEGNKSKKFTFGRFVENTIGDGIVSHVFEVFRPISNGDITYWKYAIHNEDFIAPVLMKSTVKATMMNNLIAKDFLKQQVPVPQLSEQQKIGNLLSKVDQLIELENKKLQNFQQVKKCLLQNMFVE